MVSTTAETKSWPPADGARQERGGAGSHVPSLEPDDPWRDAEIPTAVEVDAALRKNDARGIFAVEYMHRSLVPLDQVDLSTAEDHGQIDAFKNDCDGVCGV